MDRGFYGVGFPHPRVECLVGQVNKILSHYGSPTGLGKHMQVSMELLIIEARVSCQPFTEPYVGYSKWVTHSWLRLLWEKADMFQIKIEINDLPLNLPWVNDRWLMKVLEAEGYSEVELITINRVRCYQQVIFLSNILIASGRAVDIKYTRHHPRNETWSTAIFPEEKLSMQDFRLWKQVLVELDIRARNQYQLGPIIARGHKNMGMVP
jgi:hypothetical protein